MAQSTNDVIPTAIRLAMLGELAPLASSLVALRGSLASKGEQFDHVLKAGRTHLQDAMPIRLGQEFAAWSGTIERARAPARRCGGVSARSGNRRQRGRHGRERRARISGADGREPPRDDRAAAARRPTAIQLMQSMTDVASFSAALRSLALDLSKIASDLRLLASGPRTGLDEIVLPAVQPGSSIMPGKVNPSIAEMVNQVCFQVIGNDTTVAAATEHGQLELNVMMPVIAHNVLFSMRILTNAARALDELCVRGIEANEEQCAYWLERSAALATALAPKHRLREGRGDREGIGEERGTDPASRGAGEDLAAGGTGESPRFRRMTEIGVPGDEDEQRKPYWSLVFGFQMPMTDDQ